MGRMRRTFPASVPLLVVALVAVRAAAADDIELPAGEAWVHEPSGFRFPPDVGTFTRLGATRYDDDGRNVSVGYGDRALRVLMTAFVYPNTPGMSLDNHFEQVKREVRRFNPQATLVAEGQWTLEQGNRKFTGRRAAFGYAIESKGRKQSVVTEVYLLRLGGQFVKFRMTCPQDKYEPAAERLERFLKSLTLPGPRTAAPKE
jgi:hypothetical protein